MIDSTRYYDTNAQQYFDTTVDIDVEKLYDLFIPYLPKNAKILDAGCGSGRDSNYFQTQGYTVTALDGSLKMVELAREFTGLPVQHMNFSDIDYKEAFDGIWTCASLLHVNKSHLPDILKKLKKALKVQGVWYMSFRYGEGEKNEGDRFFYDQTEESLTKIVDDLGDMEIKYMGIPNETKSRRGYKFVVCILKKI